MTQGTTNQKLPRNICKSPSLADYYKDTSYLIPAHEPANQNDCSRLSSPTQVEVTSHLAPPEATACYDNFTSNNASLFYPNQPEWDLTVNRYPSEPPTYESRKLRVKRYIEELLKTVNAKLGQFQERYQVQYERQYIKKQAYNHTNIHQQELNKACVEGFIQASLQFLGQKYNQIDIQSVDISQIQEYVQAKMQQHVQIECQSQSQRFMLKYIEEFVQQHIQLRAHDQTEQDICSKIEQSQCAEITGLQSTSSTQPNSFDQLRTLQNQVELERSKMQLIKIMQLEEECAKKARDERERIYQEHIEQEIEFANRIQLETANQEMLVYERVIRHTNTYKDLALKYIKLARKEEDRINQAKVELFCIEEEIEKQRYAYQDLTRLVDDSQRCLEEKKEELERFRKTKVNEEQLYVERIKQAKAELESTFQAIDELEKNHRDRMLKAKAEHEYINRAKVELKRIEKECLEPISNRKNVKKNTVKHGQHESGSNSDEEYTPICTETESIVNSPNNNDNQLIVNTQNTPSSKINNLLQDKDSPLVAANLKNLIPQILNKLDEESKKHLAQYLPKPDLNEHGDISEDFLTRGNPVFYDSATTWQSLLSVGSFNPQRKRKHQEADSRFKDDQYEEYYGEKIEKSRKKLKGKRRQ
ncbi:hypothetical protein G6F37_007071 [Rhizopus arrhizus]|nr:hypothetical protein G6F38_010748 [Rhizopus arrhizus]KAG1157026.1 hypothetical protein G6F37_007071 [Rhizopus arrhizus]